MPQNVHKKPIGDGAGGGNAGSWFSWCQLNVASIVCLLVVRWTKMCNMIANKLVVFMFGSTISIGKMQNKNPTNAVAEKKTNRAKKK